MSEAINHRTFYLVHCPLGYLGKSQQDGRLVYGLRQREHAFHIDSLDEVRRILDLPIADVRGNPVPRDKKRVVRVQQTLSVEEEEIAL